MYIWIYANSLYYSSPIQTGHYDIVLTYCNNVSLQKCTFYTITSHHKHMLILYFIIYISNQFKTKCITIWTSYDHKHPLSFDSQGTVFTWCAVPQTTKERITCKRWSWKGNEKATGKQQKLDEILDQIDTISGEIGSNRYPLLPFVETRCCCRGLWPIDGVVHLPASVRWAQVLAVKQRFVVQ